MAMDNINQEELKRELLFKPLASAKELRDWVYLFFDLYMPMGHCYPESNSSPVEAMWEVYQAVRDNTGDKITGYILLSSRAGYKTLSVSILEVLLMIHFKVTIAHCASIEQQSKKSVDYCNSFVNKILPYLQQHGWKRTSSNTRRIELTTDTGDLCYIQIIILTDKGANCISPNSTVYLENGDKVEAKDIKSGDRIITWDYFNQKDVAVNVGSASYTRKSSKEIIFDDGSNLVASDDHMIFTQKGWITLANLRLGDRVKPLSDDPVYTQFESVEVDPSTRSLHQLILGTLLGDAHIDQIPSGKCRYTLFHCKEQLGYLEYIRDVFLFNKIECSIIPDKDGFHLFTLTYPIFEQYRTLFYKNGIKSPIEALPLLDNEGIAYWVMDDGTCHRTEEGSKKDHNIGFATCNFTWEDNKQISSFLNRLGYKSTVKEVSNSSEKTYPAVYLDLESSRELSENIAPYFVNCMRYKLLASMEIRSSYRTIDLDKLEHSTGSTKGFRWSDKKRQNSVSGRQVRIKIDKELTLKVKQIKSIGYLDLIDIHVDTDIPYLHSFYANNCLVHNSEHTSIWVADEIDLCDPNAYEEAKMIPDMFGQRFPLRIKLSTRKYAFGLMEKEISEVKQTGHRLLRWNLLDVTEHCSTEKCQSDKPKVKRYIPYTLPLDQISEEDFKKLDDVEQNNWQLIEAYPGCADCELLSACKGILHNDTPSEKKGDLIKPIINTINTIRGSSPEIAEAQLLCHKPSSTGLIYPRFSLLENVVTLQKAWSIITGSDQVASNWANFNMLVQYLKNLGIRIEAGLDWGYTNEFAIVVGAFFPDGKSFLIDSFAAPNQEFDDCLKIALEMQNRYGIQRWWADTSYPSYIRTFNRKGLKCPKFTKDVPLGIESVRGRIVNAANQRHMFVLKTDGNKRLIEGFSTYHWKMDSQGNATDKPDHTDESDIMDAVRYLYQNVYGKDVKLSFSVATGEKSMPLFNKMNPLGAKIKELASDYTPENDKKGKKRILWL